MNNTEEINENSIKQQFEYEELKPYFRISSIILIIISIPLLYLIIINEDVSWIPYFIIPGVLCIAIVSLFFNSLSMSIINEGYESKNKWARIFYFCLLYPLCRVLPFVFLVAIIYLPLAYFLFILPGFFIGDFLMALAVIPYLQAMMVLILRKICKK